MGSKYDRLTEYMNRSEPDEAQFEFTFEDIERILGEPLPKTARHDRVWWENYKRRWHKNGWHLAHVFFKPTPRVVFVRQGTPPAKGRRHPRKGLLESFFRSVPPTQNQVLLAFDEVGTIIGRALPPTALSDRTWWANTRKPPMRPAWVAAGWEVQSVYMKARRVVFRRAGSDTIENITRFVAHLLEGKRYDPQPGRLELKQWMQICARVGWFAEGTILFEKGGGWEEGLDTADRAEVEEDYAVCRRQCTKHQGGLQPDKPA